MIPGEMKRRYAFARAEAIRAIDDLDQGADPTAVFEAVETAVLWKVLLALRTGDRHEAPIRSEIVTELIEATGGE